MAKRSYGTGHLYEAAAPGTAAGEPPTGAASTARSARPAGTD
jgi:hypothetical protein